MHKAVQMTCKSKKKIKDVSKQWRTAPLRCWTWRLLSLNDRKQLQEAESFPKLLKSSLVGGYLVTVIHQLNPTALCFPWQQTSVSDFSFLPWDQAVVFLVLGKCLAELGNNVRMKPAQRGCSCPSRFPVVSARPGRCCREGRFPFLLCHSVSLAKKSHLAARIVFYRNLWVFWKEPSAY